MSTTLTVSDGARSPTFEPETELGRRLFVNPDAATFHEIRAIALYMASLWEAVAGSAERFEYTIMHYHCLNIRDETREAFKFIKTIVPRKQPESPDVPT